MLHCMFFKVLVNIFLMLQYIFFVYCSSFFRCCSRYFSMFQCMFIDVAVLGKGIEVRWGAEPSVVA